jgi:hypothetical protein
VGYTDIKVTVVVDSFSDYILALKHINYQRKDSLSIRYASLMPVKALQTSRSVFFGQSAVSSSFSGAPQGDAGKKISLTNRSIMIGNFSKEPLYVVHNRSSDAVTELDRTLSASIGVDHYMQLQAGAQLQKHRVITYNGNILQQDTLLQYNEQANNGKELDVVELGPRDDLLGRNACLYTVKADSTDPTQSILHVRKIIVDIRPGTLILINQAIFDEPYKQAFNPIKFKVDSETPPHVLADAYVNGRLTAVP